MYSIDGKNWQRDPHLAVSENGEYTIWIKDRNGNLVYATVTVDSIGSIPIIDRITQKANDNGTSTITVEASATRELMYSINGKSWQKGNTFSVSENKQYTFFVKDDLGNIISKTFMVDSVVPVEDVIEAPTEEIELGFGAKFLLNIHNMLEENWLNCLISAIVGGFLGYLCGTLHNKKIYRKKALLANEA